MYSSRTFGARDAELQSMLMALHKAHYHVHEDVVGILLHDNFRAEAMRGEYYTSAYLRHRLPLLFRLALCKWRPHQPQRPEQKKKKASLLHRRAGSSAAELPTYGGDAAAVHDSEADDEHEDGGASGGETTQHPQQPFAHYNQNAVRQRDRRSCEGRVGGGAAASRPRFAATTAAGCGSPSSPSSSSPQCTDGSSSGANSGGSGAWGSSGDASMSIHTQRETWSPVNATEEGAATEVGREGAEDAAAAAAAEQGLRNGLTEEQQMQLSLLALQILCGDRSRVREGSAEASTAACGPLWDVHTVRAFYEEHRRLVRWTCRVLHTSCEWMEDVVRRAVEDDLIEPAAPVNSPLNKTNTTTASSTGTDEALARERAASAEQQALSVPQLLHHTHVPPSSTRRSRGRRTISVERRHVPSTQDYGPHKDADDYPVAVDTGWQHAQLDTASSTTSNDSSSEGNEVSAHFLTHQQHSHHHNHHHRNETRRLASPAVMVARPPRPPQGIATPLHPLSEHETYGPPPPTHPQPQSSTPSRRTVFATTADFEAPLALHCRRIRHALMVLESLLVSLAMVQPYIYRSQPGRSNTPPWLRRDGSSSSSGSSASSGVDEDDGSQAASSSGDEDGAAEGDRGESFLVPGGIGGFRRRSRRRTRRSRSGKHGGLCRPAYEFRTDTASSFDTDAGGEEGGLSEAFVMQLTAEAEEPPLDLLVRHCLHAFTQTFLSITAVQQQLQDYSHESRHAPASTTTAMTNRSFAVLSAAASGDQLVNGRLLPSYTGGNCPSNRYPSSIVSPVTPNEGSETPSLVAARGTPAAYACAKCQRFHQVEEVLLVAANANLEVLKKSAIAFAAHHSAIAEESIRVIDAEGAVFTSQATMLLAHVLTPDLLAAHPPGSRGGMALEWVLNYVFGGISGADVRQHQQQQERQHTAGVADANSSFDCFSLANSSFSSTNPQSIDASDPDGRSSDGGWRSTLGGGGGDASDSGHSSAQSSGRWNVNRFECGEDMAESAPLPQQQLQRRGGKRGGDDDGRGGSSSSSSDGEEPVRDGAQGQPEQQTTNIRVEYILAACFTRCHPLMTVIGCVAENNQYNCGRTVAQAVLQYASTLAQTSARLLRTPLVTNTWSTPFTEAMMRGLSELAAHAHQSVSVTPAMTQPNNNSGLGGGGGAAGGAGNLTWSFASSSPAAAAAAAAASAGPLARPPQLMGPDRSIAPFLAAQLNVPTSFVSSALRRVPRPRPYSFIPPPAAVVTGATLADDDEMAQVRTMRRCLALHWAKCVLLSARTLTRAGTYDVSVPFEHYVNIRNARVQLRGRMTEYHARMQRHFEAAGNREKVRRLEEVFERWEADEQRMGLNDIDIEEYPNGSFTTATAPYTANGTPTTPCLYTVDPFGRVSPAPPSAVLGGQAGDLQTAEGDAALNHFDSNRNSHTLTATFASFAVPAGAGGVAVTGKSAATTMVGSTAGDAVRDQLLLPQPEESSPGSIGVDPLGRSFDGTNGTTITEKESYRRAFVDSFCYGKSDFELLSAALLGKARTAVLVPIHVIVCTSLFTILDAMGDVLLCEKPRLSSVVANELLTLLYEAQLSMLEPLHDGAMAVVERTGSTTPASTPPASSSLENSPVLERASGHLSDTSDSFVSPGSSLLPSTAASSDGSASSSRSSSSSASSSVTVSSEGSGSQPVSHAERDRDGSASDSESSGSDSDGQRGFSGSFGGRRGGGGGRKTLGGSRRGRRKKKKGRRSVAGKSESGVITRDGHILLFNEYALLLEAGLRTPLVVRRWREEVRRDPDHAARGYLSLLDHLQYRQSQWAEPSQEEYLVSRSTLRLMLGVTARDARGNMHGNILHVDDLDVMGSRKEEVAPRLGVTSSKDALTMLYAEEWDPSMVDPAEAAAAVNPASPTTATPTTAGAATFHTDRGGGPLRRGGPSTDSLGREDGAEGDAAAAAAAGGAESSGWHAPGDTLRRHVVLAPGAAMSAYTAGSPSSFDVPGGGNSGFGGSAVPHPLRSSALHGRPPLPTSGAAGPLHGGRMLGPRTSSFECVSLLGTRMETADDGTPLQVSTSGTNPLHQHHHDRIHHTFVDADDLGNESDDMGMGEEEHDQDRRESTVDRNSDAEYDEDEAERGDALENFSFISAGTYKEEEDGRDGAAAEGRVPTQLHLAASRTSPRQQQQQHHPSESSGSGSPGHAGASQQQQQQHEQHHHLHHPHHGAAASSHASHAPNHLEHQHHHHHHGSASHTRQPHAPWRHPPTKVTLAGVRSDLGTMVRRMPYTWALEEPVPAAVDGSEETPVNGAESSAGDNNSNNISGSAAAPSGLAVLYAPVRVTASNAAQNEEKGESEETKSEEATAADNASAPRSPPLSSSRTSDGTQVTAPPPADSDEEEDDGTAADVATSLLANTGDEKTCSDVAPPTAPAMPSTAFVPQSQTTLCSPPLLAAVLSTPPNTTAIEMDAEIVSPVASSLVAVHATTCDDGGSSSSSISTTAVEGPSPVLQKVVSKDDDNEEDDDWAEVREGAEASGSEKNTGCADVGGGGAAADVDDACDSADTAAIITTTAAAAGYSLPPQHVAPVTVNVPASAAAPAPDPSSRDGDTPSGITVTVVGTTPTPTTLNSSNVAGSPLGSGGSPSNDAALSRAIQRVLHHRRTLPPPGMLPSSLSSLNSELSISEATTPSVSVTEKDEALSTTAKSTRQHRRSHTPRDVWQQTLTQLKQSTMTSSPDSAPSDSLAGMFPNAASAVSVSEASGGDGDASPPRHVEAKGDALVQHDVSGTDGGSPTEPAAADEDGSGGASQPIALNDTESVETVSPTSPATSSSAPHDLQWYTGGGSGSGGPCGSTAHRPPRSTVSADDPMSPVSGNSAGGGGGGGRFFPDEHSGVGVDSSTGSTAQTTAEGVVGGIRIGQGGGDGRATRWMVGAKTGARHAFPTQHHPIEESSNHNKTGGSDAVGASHSREENAVNQGTRAAPDASGSTTALTVAAVSASVEHSSSSSAAKTSPPSTALKQAMYLPTDSVTAHKVCGATASAVHLSAPSRKQRTDSPMNGRSAGTAGYASSNESDVST